MFWHIHPSFSHGVHEGNTFHVNVGGERRNWSRQGCESCCCQHKPRTLSGLWAGAGAVYHKRVTEVPRLCGAASTPLTTSWSRSRQKDSPWQHRCQLLLGASVGRELQAAISADLELQTSFHLVYCYLSLLSCSHQKGRCFRERSKSFHPKVMCECLYSFYRFTLYPISRKDV